MAAVQPAGPLPRMMTLECLGELAVIFTALRLSRVWPCHIVMARPRVKAGQKPLRCIRLQRALPAQTSAPAASIREIILRAVAARVIGRTQSPDTRNAVDTRKLDAIDLRILSELQADGRITNVELSRRAKI